MKKRENTTTTLSLFNKEVVSLGDASDRTKDWVFQQKSGSLQSPCGPWGALDKILSKLYLISSKVSSMASTPPGR